MAEIAVKYGDFCDPFTGSADRGMGNNISRIANLTIMNPTTRGNILVTCILLIGFGFLILSGCTAQQPVARANDTVRVYYTVSFVDGTIVESNTNGTPLEFTLGSGSVVPGFDEAVTGLSPGQTRTVTVPPEKAYGPYRQEMVNTLDTEAVRTYIAELQDSQNLGLLEYPGVGRVYIWKRPDGSIGYLRFSNITEQTITVDENHPLAGKDLVFDITLVEILGQR